MGISPGFAEQSAPKKQVYLAHTPDNSPTASFAIEDGIPVDASGIPAVGQRITAIEDLQAYDEYLPAAGLAHFASTEAQRIVRIGSIEIGLYDPPEPERVNLTGGFIASIGALRSLGEGAVDALTGRELRAVAKQTAKLVRTLVAVVVSHPDTIFLPPNTPTQQQATALEDLQPFVSGYRTRRLQAEVQAIVDRRDELPVGDVPGWQEELRTSHLRWLTSQERRDRQEGILQLLDITRPEI
jgi:hypothetical protein